MSADVNTKYDRLYVAAVIPYNDKYEIDEKALRKFLQYFMQSKFKDAGGGIIINPEAGEIFYLTREEKRRNVEIAMEECGGKVPVFAGVSDLRTEDAVKVAVDAKEIGVDGIFLIPPLGAMDVTISWDAAKYPEVFVDMAKAEVDAVDLPAIVHPTGSPTPLYGIGLPVETVMAMCRQIPNIIGWKMTYSYQGGIIVAKALRGLDRHVGILRASARYFHENLTTGHFDGTVTGSFNYAMETMIDHIEAWRHKDIDEASRIWNSGLENLQHYVYSEYSRLHIRYKAATWLRGLIPLPFMRLPLPKPKREEITTLRDLLKGAGLSVIHDEDIHRVMNQLPS
jgi:4-hydroxy-tetrahydrodipicolinate synthase